MSNEATCKTCGASGPPWKHVPSMFDPLGIGNPGHRVEGHQPPEPTDHTDDQRAALGFNDTGVSYGIDLAEPGSDMTAVTIDFDGTIHSFVGDKAVAILALVAERERLARLDELERCTTDRIGDVWPEIRVNQEVEDGWVTVSKKERIAALMDEPEKLNGD